MKPSPTIFGNGSRPKIIFSYSPRTKRCIGNWYEIMPASGLPLDKQDLVDHDRDRVALHPHICLPIRPHLGI